MGLAPVAYDAHADTQAVRGKADSSDALGRDILDLHKVPQAFLGDGPYPIALTNEIAFSDSSQTKPKGANVTFGIPGGQSLTGTVVLTYRDARRSAIGARLKAPDGSPVTLHVNYTQTAHSIAAWC